MPPPRTRPQHVRFRGDLCAALPKVACNSTDRTFLTTQKRWNCNDTISKHKRLTGKLHATLLRNHDEAPTRSGHDQDRSRNMRTRNRRLGPLVQHPPPPLPGRHHTTTSRKSTHNNTKGSGLNKPPQNPGLDTPAKGHCTRYVALHPNRRGAMPTDRVHDPIRHKLTCGPARKDVHVPDRLGWARRRSPISWLDPGAAGPDRPSRQRAERAARDARTA